MSAREKILESFRNLALRTPYDALTTQALIADAGVARSTFYANFKDKNAVLLASIGEMLEVIVSSISGTGELDESEAHDLLEETLAHIWQNRSIGRRMFQGSAAKEIRGELERLLAIEGVDPLRSTFIAHGILGVLMSWTTGRLALTTADLRNQFSNLITPH